MARTSCQGAQQAVPWDASSGIRCVQAADAAIGESPVWCAERREVWWIDIPAAVALRSSDPAVRFALPEMPGCLVAHAQGGFVAATRGGIVHVDEGGAVLQQIAHPLAGRSSDRYNDGACDAAGRLWVGSMRLDGAHDHGALHVVERDGTVRTVLTGLALSNGIGWSPDGGSLYHVDSNRRTLSVHDFDLEQGRIGGARVLHDFSGSIAKPDGLAVDVEGCIWIAMWDGGCILRIAPDGAHLGALPLGVPRPTSCCFGGEDGQSFFITTARHGLSAAQLSAAPLSGSLIAVKAAVRGVDRHAFGR